MVRRGPRFSRKFSTLCVGTENESTFFNLYNIASRMLHLPYAHDLHVANLAPVGLQR